MAWSNRKREPRREWTEQGFGIVAFLVWAFAIWQWGHPWAVKQATHGSYYDPVGGWGITLIVGIIFAIVPIIAVVTPILLWYLVHEAGELVCEVLASIGLDPRPKNRCR